mmetsp:Transcript_4319/g.6485  ORF Transcript_4319/g.6485 Transcript_4319/m.6485 type:complete len:339 (+) Transcript_4319:196-1212(+)
MTNNQTLITIENHIESFLVSLFTPSTPLSLLSQQSCLFFIIQIIFHNLCENKHCTKRDLYYTAKNSPLAGLFSSQNVSNRLVDTLCDHFQLHRHRFGLVANDRGMIITGPDPIQLNFSNQHRKKLSPNQIHPIHALYFSASAPHLVSLVLPLSLRCVIVVEKESVFQQLVVRSKPSFVDKHRCALITARGYGDLATREFLHMVSTQYPSLPIGYLGDCDPHGIDIFLVYRDGVHANDHKRLYLKKHLSCPTIQWMGVFPSELFSPLLPSKVCMSLTQQDKQKIHSLLHGNRSTNDPFVRQQLTKMHKKAEIEALANVLFYYLSQKIVQLVQSQKKLGE